MDRTNIREALPADWEKLYELVKTNMYDLQIELELPWSRNAIVRNLSSKIVSISETNGFLQGFIAFERSNHLQFIHTLQVAPAYQHKLTGFRLFKAAVKYASGSNIRTIQCCVFSNNNAKHIYASLGFVETKNEHGILHLELNLESLDPKIRARLSFVMNFPRF